MKERGIRFRVAVFDRCRLGAVAAQIGDLLKEFCPLCYRLMRQGGGGDDGGAATAGEVSKGHMKWPRGLDSAYRPCV